MTESVTIDKNEIPKGGRKAIKLGKLEIGVFNVDGQFYAIRNECVHQLGPVCTGRISGALFANADDRRLSFRWEKDGQILTCPWHGLEFDITTGQCLALKKLRVRNYKVNVNNDKLTIAL